MEAVGGCEQPEDLSPGCSQERQMVFVKRTEPYLLILSWKYHSKKTINIHYFI